MKTFSKKTNKEIRVIELCAGVGQTSIALMKACDRLGISMKIDAFCEIDDQAAKAYEALHEGFIPNLKDITTASFIGKGCDILLATTPCTSISMAGRRTGFTKGSDTASAIVWSVFRIVDEMKEKPKFIFFENVKAMVSSKNKEDFSLLLKELEQRGYRVTYKVLNARDYNVPQNRERVYIVASLNSDLKFDFPEKEELTTYLYDILEKSPSPDLFIDTMKRQIDGTNARGFSVRVHNPGKSKYSFTLTTKSKGQNNNNYIFEYDVSEDECIRFTPKNSKTLDDYKNVRIRSLSRLEQGRLMGMSDEDIHKLDFISNTQFSKQMGNGIVIPVVEKIFYNLLEAFVRKSNLKMSA